MVYKKRVFFAFLITSLAVALTHDFWLIIKPMPFSFNMEANGKYSIKVLLNKKDNNEFLKVKTAQTTINFNEISHIDLPVNKSRFPKRLKLTITNFDDNNNEIKLKNIKLGKFNFNELDKFQSDNSKLKVENNTLIIKPYDGTIDLIYTEKLNTRTTIKFDFKVFIIILVLSYLLSYKLTAYAADFKTIKNKSRLDIIFLSIFFVFLFIPISNINQDEISKDENRTLAKLEPLIKNNEINFNFGRNFNDWFNDRFYLRNNFIASNDLKLLLSKNWKTKDVIKGKEDWLFLGWNNAVNSYSNKMPLSDDELLKIYKYLNNINNRCKAHKIKFYVFIAPDKSTIYEEFYADSIKKVSKVSKTEQLIDYMNKNSDIKIIYPKNKLLEAKNKNIIYWKTDTHWNELGAYFGYIELIETIQKDFSSIKTYKIKNYEEKEYNGDLYKMAPKFLRKEDKTLYKTPIVNNDFCKFPKDESKEAVICYNPLGEKNLLMFRDSFAISLIPYLSHSFKNSKFIWDDNVNLSDDTDIVVLEIIERNLSDLIKDYME